jgi:AraC-like DNA-binding protein
MARKDFYNVEDWAYLAKQAKYDTELLARLLNVCPRQLRRYTRELFNNSPQEWLDERRLVDASILLQGNDLVKTIAYELGFKTAAHFSKKFKVRFGVSPKAYKEWREKCPPRATQ